MLQYKKKVAAERIQIIEQAIKTRNNKLLSEQAKQSLEEDLRESLMRLISCVTMLIEDDPFGKNPVKKKDETLDKLTKEYWSIKNRLDKLVKPEVSATVPK
jgi:DNA-nicking Smr family endonuclease